MGLSFLVKCLWEKTISFLSMSKRIRTPLEKPRARRSFTPHIAVISACYYDFPNNLPIESSNPPPLLEVLLSLCSYINSQLVTSLHSKKFIWVIVFWSAFPSFTLNPDGESGLLFVCSPKVPQKCWLAEWWKVLFNPTYAFLFFRIGMGLLFNLCEGTLW